MKLFSLVSCFPSILETDKQNFFETITLERRDFTKIGPQCQKKIHNASVLESGSKARDEKVSSSLEKSREKELGEFLKSTRSQYNYLSSNIVETNAHVLGLYKKIKEFEINSLVKMKNDIETLSQKIEEGSCLSAPESEQLNTQTDIIYLHHKLDKLSDTVKQLESRLDDLKGERTHQQSEAVIRVLRNSESPSDYDLVTSNTDRCQSSPTLQSNLLRFLLPSVVTVTAIVVNMFLYVSSSRKFPY